MPGEKHGLKVLRTVGLIVLAGGLACLYLWLYIGVFKLELPKTALLRKRNESLRAQVELLSSRLDKYDRTLGGIEDRDDHVYRSIYGLRQVPDEARLAGLGGTGRYEYLDRYGADPALKLTVRRMDSLYRRISVQSTALDEVAAVAKHAGDMISCVPAVPPVLPEKGSYHISSPFGGRTDPVRGGYEYHRGQDIAAKRGTPVYATGEGLVVKADYHFGGYGNEIIIDHGYGYQSRYAHLNTIEVAEGMKVLRGTRIGTIGSSGKSTGPHLHYEVLYRGSQINPMNFMDFSMPVEEYRAMVDKVSSESAHGKKTSTSEILKRTR